MATTERTRLGLAAGAAALLAVLVLATPDPASAARPLRTAVADPGPFGTSDADLAFARTRDAGATAVRLFLFWDDTASRQPADPTDPADPAYDWSRFDRQVTLALANGLEPIVNVSEAPSWAERGSGGRQGTNRPDPVQLGRFAEAVARRYSGTFAGLPRVRNYEVWNEPNASFFLVPQFDGSRPVSPDLYREMVNGFTAAVHRVHSSNVSIAGSTFPFTQNRSSAQTVGPHRFMRELLCMTKKLRPKRKCGKRVHFDVWSHHPYTSGGPTHRAGHPDSISLGDLPRMRKLLRAAVQSRRVVSSRNVRFWVTEFGWDSNPPDPGGVPVSLHARWTAESLYRMWRSGVSLVTWWTIRDRPKGDRPYSATPQSGLYFRCATGLECDPPKRSLEAFRFPFVAFRSGSRHVRVWGRTPAGRRGRVIVEQRTGGRWRRLATLRTDRNGIFQRRLRTSNGGRLRARLVANGAAALPFSLKRPSDRRVNPFG